MAVDVVAVAWCCCCYCRVHWIASCGPSSSLAVMDIVENWQLQQPLVQRYSHLVDIVVVVTVVVLVVVRHH